MSQSHHPTDTQALLQSMLQRLKLQPGRDGQAYLHTPVPITHGQDGQRGAANIQKSPVNDFGNNGIPSKDFEISAAGSNFGLKGGEIQQPSHGRGVDRGLISSPSQNDSIDGDRGENRALGQATQPGITPTGTGQLFPAKSLKDADITSFERTDGERVSFGSSATTKHTPPNTAVVSSTGLNQNQGQGFTPKVYTWSLKSTHTDTGGRENTVSHVGNGELGALAQSNDEQFVSSNQTTANSSLRRKQLSSESKTRRWTAKIKERWKDRPGSFARKGKEEGGTSSQKSEQATEISPQNQDFTAENLTSMPNNDGEGAFPSLDSSGASKTLDAPTEDSAVDGKIRSTSDFEFGLGSFSLLEEIVKGQEWAMFLNPNVSAASANQRPAEEPLSQPKIQPNPQDSNQSSGFLSQLEGGSNQWTFRSTESSPATVFGDAQISPDAFSPVNMDVTEGKRQQAQSVHREADQSEPMEYGHNQPDMQPGERRLGRQRRRPPSAEPSDILHSSVLKSRVLLSRKRQHHSAGRRDEKISDGEEANGEGSMTSSHAMDETGESQHDNVTPLYIQISHPTPLFPSSLKPRSVLKHSISQDSESSMEIVTKRRRVEENRRVRFSEEVVSIDSPDLELDDTDSEEDSEAEEDSVTEQQCEVQPAARGEAAPARRPALPNWIRALKRKNAGRKPR